MKPLNGFLITALLLSVATPASASWILYRQEAGSWRPSGVYQDLKVCEAEAKALADKLQVLAGCAPPSASTAAPAPRYSSPTTTVDSYTCKDKMREWNKERAARYRAFGEAMSNNAAFDTFAQKNPECVK